jgi:hypothetical protein
MDNASCVVPEGQDQVPKTSSVVVGHIQRELPDDVLAIVRAYAKPSFKYFKEYNQALKINHLDQWKTLLKKLKELKDDKQVDEILFLLRAYQRATEDWHKAMKEEQKLWEIGYTEFNMFIMRQERNKRVLVTQAKKWDMNKVFSILSRLLYGTEKGTYELRIKGELNTWI